MTVEKPRVCAVYCHHRASDEDVYLALKRATAPLERAWARLERARRITIKFNQAWPPNETVYFNGRFQELVDPAVARATLRLLRERTAAEIVCPEISTYAYGHATMQPVETMTLLPILREFDVPWLDGGQVEQRLCPVPGGGAMFRQYLLPACAVETDAFISVQKVKSHRFGGVTLALKNLFGLPPLPPRGRTRSYFHHLVRLPHVLADLGAIIQPTLNILDGLVGQSEQEWGGDGRVCDTLIAGDQVIATDACGAHLMGFDPLGRWPDQPFIRDDSALRIAQEHGYGTADLAQIAFTSEVRRPIAQFHTLVTDSFEMTLAWRRSTCRQALYYRDHRAELAAQYAGEYVLLQDGEVVWHSPESEFRRSRRDLAGPDKASALYLKLVDPDEVEGEHFEVYERILADLDARYPER